MERLKTDNVTRNQLILNSPKLQVKQRLNLRNGFSHETNFKSGILYQVTHVCYSHSKKSLFICGMISKLIFRVRATDLEILEILKEHKDTVRCLDHHEDSQMLVSGSRDNYLLFWKQIKTENCLRHRCFLKMSLQDLEPRVLQFNQEGTLLFVGFKILFVHIICTKTFKTLRKIRNQSFLRSKINKIINQTGSVLFSPVSMYLQNLRLVFHPLTKAKCHIIKNDYLLKNFEMIPDRQVFLSKNKKKDLQLCSAFSFKKVFRYTRSSKMVDDFYCLKYDPYSKSVFEILNMYLCVFKITQSKKIKFLHHVKIETESPSAIELSGDSSTLYLGQGTDIYSCDYKKYKESLEIMRNKIIC